MCCYVTLSNVFQVKHMKICIHYSTRNLLASYKVCFLLQYKIKPCMVWLFNLTCFAEFCFNIFEHNQAHVIF